MPVRCVNAAASSRSLTASAPPGAEGRSREPSVARKAAAAPATCCSRPVQVGHQVGAAGARAGAGELGGHADAEEPLAELVVQGARQAAALAQRGDLLDAGPVARGRQGGPRVGAEAPERLQATPPEGALAAQARVEHPAHLATERDRDAREGADALLARDDLDQLVVEGAPGVGRPPAPACRCRAPARRHPRRPAGAAPGCAGRGCRAPPSSRAGRSSGAAGTAGGGSTRSRAGRSRPRRWRSGGSPPTPSPTRCARPPAGGRAAGRPRQLGAAG